MQAGDLLFALEGAVEYTLDVRQLSVREVGTQPRAQILQRHLLAEALRLVVRVEILDLRMTATAFEQQEHLRGGLQELVGPDAVAERLQIARVAHEPACERRTAAEEAGILLTEHAFDELGIAGATDLTRATADQRPECLVTGADRGRTLQ